MSIPTTMAQIRRHGLTAIDKAEIATEQGGCAICGRPDPGRKGWVVDHDRSCCSGDQSCLECRRGILCLWCNNALGYAFDSPMVLRRMADYLELGTRMHPSQVYDAGRLTDQLRAQLSDQSTDKGVRNSQASPTETTDETDEELTTTARSTFPPLRARAHTGRSVMITENGGATRQPEHCPTHAVCPPCREGWGHWTPGHGYQPTVESIRARAAIVGAFTTPSEATTGSEDPS